MTEPENTTEAGDASTPPARASASRDEHGRFRKGASPNPGGRPKEDPELKALARAHTPDAIRTLVAIMRSKKSPAAARVSAAQALLDRGHGRAAQAIEVKAPAGSPKEIEAVEEVLRKIEQLRRGGDTIEGEVAPLPMLPGKSNGSGNGAG